MTEKNHRGEPAPGVAKGAAPDAEATPAHGDDDTALGSALRLRLKDSEDSLRDRFDEPIARATKITRATLATFPVRLWRHFLNRNGFLLAAGVSYQALFAFFAGIYVAFATAGIWLGASPAAINGVIAIINSYIPGLISDSGGLITPAHAAEIATSTSSVLTITGIVALGALIWTAIGWVTFSRRAVRDIFGLVPDRRNYFLLKARDLFAAALFALALIVGATLSAAGSVALDWVLSLFGLTIDSTWISAFVRIGSGVVSFALNTVALAAMFRFLTGTSLRWRVIWPGAAVGGVALTVLQLGTGLLLTYSPSNPLLATFAIFIGLLLWFRLQGVVMLVAASWVATASKDKYLPLTQETEEERLAREHEALKITANVRLREAHAARARAPWYGVWAAERELREAQAELARVEASAPQNAAKSGSLFE